MPPAGEAVNGKARAGFKLFSRVSSTKGNFEVIRAISALEGAAREDYVPYLDDAGKGPALRSGYFFFFGGAKGCSLPNLPMS